MANCVDLVERFGKLYRIGYEEQSAEWPQAERQWLARIRCQHGHVGVQGGEMLHAFTNRRGIGRRLRELAFAEKVQGDAETRIVFHVDHLAAVLALLKPRKRRQMTDEERARLKGLSDRFGYRTKRISESEITALESLGRVESVPADTGGAPDAKSATRAAGGSGEAA